MGYGLIDNNTLTNIANAIREKTNSNAVYYPRDMARAISQINTAGGISTPVVLSMLPYMALNDYGSYTTNNYNNTTYFTSNMREFVRTNNLPENATILTRVDWEGMSPSEVYLFEANNSETVGLYCEDAEPESISILDMTRMFASYMPNFNMSAFCTDLTECMDFAFNGQYKMTGPAACGERVRYFRYAYQGCSLINEAVCGNNVVDMTGAYNGCSNIKNGPSGPYVLRMENTYRYCYNVNEIYIGPLVWTIENIAYSCYNLVEVYGGENVTHADNAFNGCNNLTTIGEMPLIENASLMFNRCDKLSPESAYNFMLAAKNLRYAYCMFNNCTQITQGYLWNNLETISYMFNGCTNLVSVLYSESFHVNQYYGFERVFQNCHNLLEPIPCPGTINKMIGTYMECRNLQNYIIGENVTNIYECFNNCQSLTQDVVLGENINGISRAFTNCYQIQNFAILNTNIANEWYGENTFARSNYDLRRNIVVASMVSLSAFFSRNMAGTGIAWTPVVEAAEVNVGGNNYNTVRCYYNTAVNCYVYCME